MNAEKKLINEDSPEVENLAKNKRKLSVVGLHSHYKLNNGWVATRTKPENGWSRESYWSINDAKGKFLGGGHGRLTRAITNVLNFSKTTNE